MRQGPLLEAANLRRRGGWAPSCVVAALALIAAASIAGSQPAEAGAPGHQLREVESLANPVSVENAPGAPRLLFVVQQGGRVQVLRDEVDLPGAFLNITDRVSFGGEQGLLSIAFHPDYELNRLLYVYYVTNGGDIRVDQVRRSLRSPGRAQESTLKRVITIPHPVNANHNGGQVTFGDDGHLYLASGDGGSGCDPGENAQDKGSLLGKLLRITPLSQGGYSIPPDNPFVGRAGRDEIWSYGLRNPFRFSFDTALEAVAIGDVGQDQREEVDLLTLADARGENFGWDGWEGLIQSTCGTPPPPGAAFPMHDYPNPPGSAAAVTGGVVVRDPDLDSLSGRYVFADFFQGEIRSFIPDLENNEADALADTGLEVAQPVAFVEGAQRQLYVVSLAGAVYAVEPGS